MPGETFMANARVNLRLKSSFAGIIYDHIKELIITGKLKPDQRITVQEFARYFNVSITPVREAFQRLLAEKYLSSNNTNRNELRVINLSSEEMNNIYELLRALDTWGMRKSLAALPDKVISKLTAMHEVLKEYYEKRQLKSYFRQNFEIHSTIWKVCHNDFIYETMINAQEKISIFLSLFPEHFYSSEVLDLSFQDHCDLIEAIRLRDVNGSVKILERHWREGFFPETEAEAAGLQGPNP
jgi:DNA-binding GntR family transcriptional regulator